MTRESNNSLLLGGVDGANPLGFLAALGTLRTLSLAWPDREVKLSWVVSDAWRPTLHATGELSPDGVVESLHMKLRAADGHAAFADMGENLSVKPDDFRTIAEEAASRASRSSRSGADFIVAFGCEITPTEKGETIQDTAFRTMGGAGHQHFLGFIRNLVSVATPEHLRKTLFEPWRYDDAVEKQTMRIDPSDDTRYALQWRNPSGDPTRKKRGSMVGANRLAIEALPLFPTAPVGSRLMTTGFIGRRSRDTFWTWPIWDGKASLDVIRSLLSLAELQRDEPPRDKLTARGIVEVYRSQRLTIGKLRNFSPARSV